MSYDLKKHLFDCYGSFADKRIKKIEKGRTFICDDRARGGIASDGSLYGWFCGILVEVDSDDEVVVTLHNSVPHSPVVDSIYASLDGDPKSERVRLRVSKAVLPQLKKLSNEIAAIVARGRRYGVPGYKHMCPMTAASLERLTGFLRQFWK